MARRARPRSGKAGVAHRAIAVGAAVAHWECVIELDVVPVGRVVVARGARRAEVIGRALVTHRTIHVADEAVVKLDILPIGGVFVAVVARQRVVIGRRLMAGHTVRVAEQAMVNLDILPVGGVFVAGSACEREVVGRRLVAHVAAQVAEEGVIDNRRLPRIGVVAPRTLAGPVVGRLVFGVATNTIRQAGVVHVGRQPGDCGMAP